jgi:hypothetical protein
MNKTNEWNETNETSEEPFLAYTYRKRFLQRKSKDNIKYKNNKDDLP